MNIQPKKKPALKGVELTTDQYFKKPALRFGEGKQTCTLTASRLRHILRALKENAPTDVIKAMENLVELEYGKQAPQPVVKIAQGTHVPTTSSPKPASKPPRKPQPQPQDDCDLSNEDEEDDPPGTH